MHSPSIPGFPTGACGQEERRAPEPTAEVRNLRDDAPYAHATAPPSNVVAYGDGRITWNQQNVRVAMSPKRIRIGCTEVSIEAAREILQQHGLRFGKPPEEVWQEVQ